MEQDKHRNISEKVPKKLVTVTTCREGDWMTEGREELLGTV